MATSLTDIEKSIPGPSAGSTAIDSMTTPKESATNGHSAASATAGHTTSPAQVRRREYGDMVLVPAGFIADILGGLSGTIGEVTGGLLGNATVGKQIGEAASPLVKLLPFQVVPPSVTPQGAGPDAPRQGPDEALIVVPNAFLGGLIGGIGGNLLGSTIGGWLGDEETGGSIGSTVGGVLGGLLPFQVVPPAMMPQGAGPDGGAQGEPMVVVPAGFFGDLLSGVAGTVGGLVGGDAGRQIGDTASPFLRLLPFQAVPTELSPQSAGPGGLSQDVAMTVLPAGFFGSLLSGMAETVGGAVGGLFGDSRTGASVGGAVAPILNMLPFHAVPPGVVPQSAGPAAAPQDQLMFVPAGLFGSLLNCWGSTLTSHIDSTVTDLTGSSALGKAAGDLAGAAASALRDLVPFSVVPPARVG